MGYSYAMLGQYDAAIRELEGALITSQNNNNVLGSLGFAYAKAGQRERALRIAAELQSPQSTEYVPAYMIANIFAALGEDDLAFEWLERAFEARSSYMILLKHDILLENIRNDPRFTDLVARIGIP